MAHFICSNNSVVVTLYVFCILQIFNASNGLKCYQCLGSKDDKCNDPFMGSSDLEVTCDDEDDMCYKVKVSSRMGPNDVAGQDEVYAYVSRGCGNKITTSKGWGVTVFQLSNRCGYLDSRNPLSYNYRCSSDQDLSNKSSKAKGPILVIAAILWSEYLLLF